MTNLEAGETLENYFQRMKIEQTFWDLKSLLNLHRLMNKCRTLMNKMNALILTIYALVHILGEPLRVHLFPENSRKYKLYSGPFVILKLKPTFPLCS